jgi:hypothetical protein
LRYTPVSPAGGYDKRPSARRGAGAGEGVAPPLERGRLPPVPENAVMKRLMWSGLVAGLGAVAAIAANRVAATVWRRVFDEDPPD